MYFSYDQTDTLTQKGIVALVMDRIIQYSLSVTEMMKMMRIDDVFGFIIKTMLYSTADE